MTSILVTFIQMEGDRGGGVTGTTIFLEYRRERNIAGGRGEGGELDYQACRPRGNKEKKI